jgi:hypothetical protein
MSWCFRSDLDAVSVYDDNRTAGRAGVGFMTGHSCFGYEKKIAC